MQGTLRTRTSSHLLWYHTSLYWGRHRGLLTLDKYTKATIKITKRGMDRLPLGPWVQTTCKTIYLLCSNFSLMKQPSDDWSVFWMEIILTGVPECPNSVKPERARSLENSPPWGWALMTWNSPGDGNPQAPQRSRSTLRLI